MKFWLDQGASGFRVDMAGSLVKNDPTGKETGDVWKRFTDWLDDEYPEAVMVSEWSNPTVALPAGFDMDFTLTFNMPGFASLWRKPSHFDRYGFSFFDPAGHGNIRAFVDEYLPAYNNTREIGFISMPTGNHDTFPRISEGRSAQDMQLIYLFLMSMPGVPYIYYGDEIGMRALPGWLPSKAVTSGPGCARPAVGCVRQRRFFTGAGRNGTCRWINRRMARALPARKMTRSPCSTRCAGWWNCVNSTRPCAPAELLKSCMPKRACIR